MSSLKTSSRPWLSALRFFAAAVFLLPGFVPVAATAASLKLPTEKAAPVGAANSAALALQNAFIDVASKVSPAVVNIGAEWTEDVRGFNDFGNPNDFFNFFFYGPHGMPNQRLFKQKQRSLGSGFIITPDGYILTNAHVVGKADKVTVTFEDGTTYPAKIVGKDEKVDIAVVKISDGKKIFPYAVLGDSDTIKVGQWAIAIGNPFALDHTVTTGVISAKGRSVEVSNDQGVQNYIQTDASINPGNSGGPLCDIEGRVIGINSAIYSQSGGSVGIGFAIPANIARKAAEDLVNSGKIIRAGLGCIVQGLTPQMAKSFGLSSTEGALLSQINPGGAAEKSGLKAGDIVLAVNGEKIASSGDLVAKLYTHSPGETVQLTILRNGQQSDVPVTLQELKEASIKPENPSDQDNNDSGQPGAAQNENLGLAFQDQTPDIQSQLPAGAPKGPVVTNVIQQSPAAAAGIQPGDVILKVGDTAIVSAKQLAVVLKKSNLKNGVRLYLWRDGTNLFAFLQSGDE
ncbi:MAG TPA: Do family serine endopeptidase [bacterium]|nr:Do family serine endopeptidase [bacterium]